MVAGSFLPKPALQEELLPEGLAEEAAELVEIRQLWEPLEEDTVEVEAAV